MSNATIVSSERLVNPKTLTCHKCQGTGRVPYARAGGRCFSCGGSGKRRDRTRVVREVRHTFFVPEGMEINLMVNAEAAAPRASATEAAPAQGDLHSGGGRAPCTSLPSEAPQTPCEPHLVGLPWAEQARIRALQRDGS